MSLTTSENGLNLIKKFEGCKLTAYQDSAGVWSIGYGHTSGVKKGQKITQAQADSYLKSDVKTAENKVNDYNSVYSWNQNQFDALVSFAFNIGTIKQLTADGTRTISTISSKILEYNKAGGVKLQGLVDRRKAEKELFDKEVSEVRASEGAESGPDSSIAGTYKINAKSGLNIRDGAGSDKEKLIAIPYGTEVQCYGYYTLVGLVEWYYVQFNYNGVKYTGFACSAYLTKAS